MSNLAKLNGKGNKSENKEYFRHTNFPGGARFTSVKQVKKNKPEFMLHNSVKGMLPHNRLGRAILKHLKIIYQFLLRLKKILRQLIINLDIKLIQKIVKKGFFFQLPMRVCLLQNLLTDV